MSIRVVLADDQAMVRAGFRMILESDPEIEVVGEAANGE
ncbi:MAG TPA: DNA-binding response regulator, partial [Pseudonocardiaceae bacterium]|nr:DNA-binding response regulator [Pseudonocardiaceae bacterium]